MKRFQIFIWIFLLIRGSLFPFDFSRQDKKRLEPFFYRLLTKETVGYVLLGEKPLAFISYIPELSLQYPFFALGCMQSYHRIANQTLKRGWKVWRKYASQRSDKILFIEETSPYNPLCKWIFVINCNLFCKTVDEHRLDFERILGKPITGRALLEDAKDKPLFSNVLKGNEILLGILLGFGRNNAYRYVEGRGGLGVFPKQEDRIQQIDLPVFRADWSDPETHALREKYLRCRDRIEVELLNQGPLDCAIEMLFSP